jgi:hypothetical protein
MSASPKLYKTDFFAWSQEQAALLCEGKASEADLANIAEEIESMGKTARRLSVEGQRLDLADLTDDNPSLQPYLAQVLG